MKYQRHYTSAVLPVTRTWYVKTDVWEQQAVSSDELVDLIDEALDEGLLPTIELC